MNVKAFEKPLEHGAFSCIALATYLEHRDQILISDHSSICAAKSFFGLSLYSEMPDLSQDLLAKKIFQDK